VASRARSCGMREWRRRLRRRFLLDIGSNILIAPEYLLSRRPLPSIIQMPSAGSGTQRASRSYNAPSTTHGISGRSFSGSKGRHRRAQLCRASACRFLARRCRDDWTILLRIRVDCAVVVGPRQPICIIALATQRGLGWHNGIALLVVPLRATGDSFGAYHCGSRDEALRVARSR
jgi:hypothetical protein